MNDAPSPTGITLLTSRSEETHSYRLPRRMTGPEALQAITEGGSIAWPDGRLSCHTLDGTFAGLPGHYAFVTIRRAW